MSAQTMAEVIMQHPWFDDGLFGQGRCPTCGVAIDGGFNSPSHAAHLSDMLTAAGFGPVNRVRHDAYNSGYAAGRADGMLFPPTRTGTKR